MVPTKKNYGDKIIILQVKKSFPSKLTKKFKGRSKVFKINSW